MLYSTAGSRLYLADAPAAQVGAIPAAGWVEIGQMEAIGMLGVEWQTETTHLLSGPQSELGELTIKTVETRPEMPLVMGNDPADAGQSLLWQASRSGSSFPFRLVFPDGVTTRQWFALVIRIGEVFDTANSIMKLQVDIKPTSTTTRSA